jgi:O-antigen/teichoic acid export membrane protein
MAMGLGSLCFLVLLTGDWLPVFVYGNQYADCGSLVLLLALARLASSLGVVAANGLWAIEQPRLNFVADVCSVVATALAVAMLVYPFGAWGAAAALLIGASIDAVVRLFTLGRALRKSHASSAPLALTAPLISEHAMT